MAEIIPEDRNELFPTRLEFQDFALYIFDEERSQSTNPLAQIKIITVIVDDEIEAEMKKENFECPICYNSISQWDAVLLNCKHTFCGTCIVTHLEMHKNTHPACALCRSQYSFFEIPNLEICEKIECLKKFFKS